MLVMRNESPVRNDLHNINCISPLKSGAAMPKIISINRWRPLYELARQIGEMAPWKALEEVDIFAVHDPESNQTGYVSIMGSLGKHKAVAAYIGNEGLWGFFTFQNASDRPQPTLMLSTPQIQLSYEKRGDLEPEDLFIIHELDFKPQRSNEWPMFRCYRPGFAPRFLDQDEISFFRVVLEQTLVVLGNQLQMEQIPDALAEDKILVRRGKSGKSDINWRSETMPLFPPEDKIYFVIDGKLEAAVRNLPVSRQRVYLDLQILMNPIQEKKDERPYFAYLLAFMDEQNGLMLHFDSLTAKDGWRTFLSELPEHIVRGLYKLGSRPIQLLIRDPILIDMMTPLQEKFGLAIKSVTEMPAMDEFVEGFHNITRRMGK